MSSTPKQLLIHVYHTGINSSPCLPHWKIFWSMFTTLEPNLLHVYYIFWSMSATLQHILIQYLPHWSLFLSMSATLKPNRRHICHTVIYYKPCPAHFSISLCHTGTCQPRWFSDTAYAQSKLFITLPNLRLGEYNTESVFGSFNEEASFTFLLGTLNPFLWF
jgi:hypothetical protein